MSSLILGDNTQEKTKIDISFDDITPQLRADVPVLQSHSTLEKTEILTQLSQGESFALSGDQSRSLMNREVSSRKVPVSSFKYKNSLRKRSSHAERVQKYIHEKQRKVSMLAEQISQCEIQECTFKPQTNNRRSARSIEHFLRDQSEFSDSLTKKRERLLSEITKLPSDVSFTPSINKESSRCASRYSSTVYDHLYNHVRSPMSVEEEQFTFVPSINPYKTQDRPENIHLHLYSKAASQTANYPQTLKKKLISKTSESIVVTKFKKEFNQACSSLQKETAFSYSMYILLLQKLHFVKQDNKLALQAWNLLSNKTKVKKKKLLEFLLSVMNYKVYFPQAYHEYRSFYLTRINDKSKSRSCDADNPPFKPKISLKSERLAKSKQAEREPDFLVKEKSHLRHKFSKMRTEKAKEEVKKYSFSPKINKKVEPSSKKKIEHRALALYTLSSLKRQESKQMIEEAAMDQMMDVQQSCTFSPNIRSSLLKDKKKVVGFKGVDEAVERIQKARSDTAKRKTMLVRGVTFVESDESFKFDKSPVKAPVRKLKRSLTRRDTIEAIQKKRELNKSADLSEDSDFIEEEVDNVVPLYPFLLLIFSNFFEE